MLLLSSGFYAKVERYEMISSLEPSRDVEMKEGEREIKRKA